MLSKDVDVVGGMVREKSCDGRESQRYGMFLIHKYDNGLVAVNTPALNGRVEFDSVEAAKSAIDNKDPKVMRLLNKDVDVVGGMVREKSCDAEILVDVNEVKQMSPAEIDSYSHFSQESLKDDGWSLSAIRELFKRKEELIKR